MCSSYALFRQLYFQEMDTPKQPVPPSELPKQPPEPPEMPKYLTRRSAVVMAIGFGALLLIALTRFSGESATISAKGVGPLTIGKSSRTAMQNWATGPISFWFTQKGSPPVHFKGQLWQYKCVGGKEIFGVTCRTLYGITNGHLATVETNNPQFYTAAGTHIGTSLEDSRTREHAKWSGWNVKCPHLVLTAPKGVSFFVSFSKDAANPKGYATGFYLSATPSSFAYCGGHVD